MRFLFSLFSLIPIISNAQTTIVSGPMLGHQTDSTATIWLLLEGIPHAASPTGEETKFQMPSSPELELMLTDLKSKGYDDIDHKVQERMVADYKTVRIHLKKTSPTAKDAPKKIMRNFSFLTGSCAFPYPYKGMKGKKCDFIFKSMTETPSDFMIWLGDNTYYLDKEWESYDKMFLKNAKMRTNKHINEFIQTRPQYAIWDDHDYGPNNSDSTYANKDVSLEVFKDFWANPYYGKKKAPGNYSHFRYEDVEIFLMDARYYRSKKKDEMFGEAQMEWLRKQLKKSDANFKIIVAGTQMLPTEVRGESWQDFKDERKDFLKFIKKEKITGVIFMSGDRHYTELNFNDRGDKHYPLYEFSCSPLTSFGNPSGRMKNKMRSKRSLYMKQNYGRVSFAGESHERECTLEVFDKQGFLVWSHIIPLSDLE